MHTEAHRGRPCRARPGAGGPARPHALLLCGAAALLLPAPVTGLAAEVRSDTDYQLYRDFAENRGRFTPGATDVPVYTLDGTLSGVLNAAPMPDFSATDRQLGVATLVSPQTIVSVAHNGGYGSVQFGGSGSSPYYHRHTYVITDRNNSPTQDFHAPRLDKVVTEVAPAAVTQAGTAPGTYTDASRFTAFYRLGSGTQKLRDRDGTLHDVAGAYEFLTGGTLGTPFLSDTTIGIQSGDIYATPLGNYGIPGDSGSPLYAYDALLKKWVLTGVLNSYTGPGGTNNYWTVIPVDFLAQTARADSDGTVAAVAGGGVVRWAYSAAAGTGTLTQGRRVTAMHGLAGTDLNAGRDLTFGPGGGRVVLTDSVNQGAGALTFQGQWTVAPQGAQTWQGGGVITAAGSDVIWQVNGAGGDSLHKVGPGTLRINATGVNPGELSAGDGTVVLDQQPDASGQRQAFRVVDIVSGRPTVVLNSADQLFSTDTLYFGYRGGRLDLNGHSLTFGRINAVDDGARIVNHGTAPATLTVTGPSGSASAGTFVYPGRFGEDDPQRPNQGLNVAWQPAADGAVLAVTGGASLNGSLRAGRGVLLLSGRPVLHAGNVTVPDDWTVSAFRATATDVAPGAALQVGEYAVFQTSGLTAWGGSRVAFGYNGSADAAERLWRCTLDDNTGASACGQPQRSAQEQAILPLSRVSGSVTLAQDARLIIGRALWSGRLAAYPTAVTALYPGAVWQLPGDSRAGVLRALPGSTADLAVATEGRWQPKQLLVQRLDATGLTVGLGADPAGGRADRLDVLDAATGGGNVLQVSFLSALPGTLSPDGLVLATAPAGTPPDYFSLTPITRGFSVWRARLQSREDGGRRVWAVSPVNAAARRLLALPAAAPVPVAGTAPDAAAPAAPSAPSAPAAPAAPDAAADVTPLAAAPGLLPAAWFTPAENTVLTDATRRQLAAGDTVLAGLAETDAQRPTDLLLSGRAPGAWVTPGGSRTAGAGRGGTTQTLAFGLDAGDAGLTYGLSAAVVQARSDSGGGLSATAKAGSAGGWVTVRTAESGFVTADLRALRLNQTLQPDPSLALAPGDMNQSGVAGRLRAGRLWLTDDGGTAVAPWAGLSGNRLSGARLAGDENALTRAAGTSLWAGAGLDARRAWRTDGGLTLAVTGGVSAMRRLTAPGVALEDAAGVRRYGAPGGVQQTVYAGLEGTLTARLTLSLTAARRSDGPVRESAATAGLQWRF